VNRTGAALRGVTADVGAGQPQLLTDEVDEQGSRLDLCADRLAVHGHANCHGHEAPPIGCFPTKHIRGCVRRGRLGRDRHQAAENLDRSPRFAPQNKKPRVAGAFDAIWLVDLDFYAVLFPKLGGDFSLFAAQRENPEQATDNHPKWAEREDCMSHLKSP
jgi:hypothetical protein